MTRLLVLVLAAFNLLYFGWSRWIGRDQPQLVATAPPRPVAPALPAGAPPCATLGPFSDVIAAQQAKDRLEAGGLNMQRRDATEILHDGWWVHVDSADSDSQARTLAALRRAGINDAFAMPDDPQFRVSVGIFSSEERAQDRAARVVKLKLDAGVTERLRDQTVIWYDIAGIAPETLRDGRLASAGVALDKLRVESCTPPAAAAPAEAGADIIPPP